MFSLALSRGKTGEAFSKRDTIRENVSYPRVKVTPTNDSCLDQSMPCEHVLYCCHIIITAKPNEPCAPNCHHVKNNKGGFKNKEEKDVSRKEFYCDACVESENEALIPDGASPSTAETKRAEMRRSEAKSRGKDTKYRKCYIGLKVTSIPCHSDGRLKSGYVPRETRHPFDTALPQTGDNMFEDIDLNPAEQLDEMEVEGTAVTVVEISGTSGTGRETSSSDGRSSNNTRQTVPDKEERRSTRNGLVRRTRSAGTTATSPAPNSVRTRPHTIESRRRDPIATPQSTRKRKKQVIEDEEEESEAEEEEVVQPTKQRRPVRKSRKHVEEGNQQAKQRITMFGMI